MKIINKKLSDLVEYQQNNKLHPEKQINHIAESIKRFGFNVPVLIDKDNIIVAGHGRYLASKQLELKEIPCILLENLTETEINAFRIIDNSTNLESGYNLENLKLELHELKLADFDLETFGLDDLSSLFPEDEASLDAQDDDFEPSEQKEIYIKEGDLIELNQHRVLCGDSIINSNYLELLKNIKIDLLITDPPYGVSYADKNKMLNTFDNGSRVELKIENDSLNSDQMYDLWSQVFLNIDLYLSEKASYYIFGASKDDLMLKLLLAINLTWQLKHELIWVKNNHVLGFTDYCYKHEPILYGWRKNKSHNFYPQFKTTVLEFNKPTKNDLHPTMKPIELIGELISNSSKESDNILDPFLGSGSTLIASEQLNRTCFGLELSPKYCQVIIDRYKAYCDTNNKPCLIKINGKEFKKES